MSERLTAYELSLSGPHLYAYMVTESQRLWRIAKSPTATYDHALGMEEFIRRNPALYQRYQAVVLKHDADPAPLVHPASAAPSRDEAREDLEALAKSYVTSRLVNNEAEGLAMAIQARPDLYRAFASPRAAQGPPDPDPLRELQRKAHEYVEKRLVASEEGGMERAIRERPELYQAHRKQVQAVTVQKVVR